MARPFPLTLSGVKSEQSHTGLGKVKARMFRIGHLGECNDLTLMAGLSGCEMGLKMAGVRLRASGTTAAMEHLGATARPPAALGAARTADRRGST